MQLRTRFAAGLVAAAGVAVWPAPATADQDTVVGTRSELLREQSHSVAITLAPGHARLVVKRTVYNAGARHDQAVFDIFLPPSAVATGLRTLGTLRGRPHWFAGELMEAEAAAAKYRELTGIGGYYPKDPALLSWHSQEHLALQVFPCPPLARKTVEYTLTVPTEYSDGRHRLELPAMGTSQLLASVTVRAKRKGDRILVDGQPLPKSGKVRLRAVDTVRVELVPHAAPTLGGALAVKEFGAYRVLSRFRIEAAPKLSQVPRRAHVVVVLDGSRSLDQYEADGAVAAARAYLSHFPDAHAEVLTFDRVVRKRHGKFVPAQQARADLQSHHITQRNGSNVDAALSEADRLLSRTPAKSARRAVVLTDARTRSSLTPQRLRASFGSSGAVLHIGVLDGLDPVLEPNPDHAWDRVARSTGGLVWRAGANDSPSEAEALRATYEEWARPLRLHRFRVTADGIDINDSDVPDVLDEGEGVTDLRISTLTVPWVKVEGELWAKPVRTVLLPDAKETRRWSALVFGSDLLHELSEPEMMTLAMHGRAVSPVTSYLAIEPGVRPSTEGLDWFGAGGLGLTGVGHGGGGFGAGVGSIGPTFDPQQWLENNLRQGWTACGGTADTASVTLESTFAEVVDVTRVELDITANATLERCLAQAVWDLDLPSGFKDPWRSWVVRV